MTSARSICVLSLSLVASRYIYNSMCVSLVKSVIVRYSKCMQSLEQRRRIEQKKRMKKMYGYWWLHQNDRSVVERMAKEFNVSKARIYQVISEFIKNGEPNV